MVLTNAEKQRRWRQRHSDRRRAVARITTMLMRPSHTERSAIEAKVGWNTVTLDTYFLKLADLICNVLKTDRAIKQLRWALAIRLRDRKWGRWHDRGARERSRQQAVEWMLDG